MAYAYTAFEMDEAREIEFRGAADNLTVWINGERAFGFEEYRNGVRLDCDRRVFGSATSEGQFPSPCASNGTAPIFAHF